MKTDKIWYIKFDNVESGPYSINELKLNPEITPDTLARNESSIEWKPLRYIPELNEIFEDEIQEDKTDEEESENELIPHDEITLQLPNEPTYLFLFWLVIVAVIISYVLYRLYWNL